MAKIKEHQLALELRKQGKSYSQIKKELGLSKSTLSVWLRKYPLSKERINQLRARSEVRIERYRQTMQRKRELRMAQYIKEEKEKWLPLSEKELFLAGLFLYWGEGGKTLHNQLSINNTDPDVLKFILYWMRVALVVPKDKIQVFLHLYSDMDTQKELNFWSKELNMSLNYFAKPYIKKSMKSGLTQKGFGHGTCGLRINNTVLKERILMAIKAMAEHYGEKLKESDIIEICQGSVV